MGGLAAPGRGIGEIRFEIRFIAQLLTPNYLRLK
jgi:hypothetical protein